FYSFFQFYYLSRDLHSFPTRRSSDLELRSDRGKLDDVDSIEGPPVRVRDFQKFVACFGQRDVEHFFAGLRAGKEILEGEGGFSGDRKSTRLNSSHDQISYAVFCLKKK